MFSCQKQQSNREEREEALSGPRSKFVLRETWRCFATSRLLFSGLRLCRAVLIMVTSPPVQDHLAMFEPAWLAGEQARRPDTHVAFRGSFSLLKSTVVQFNILGASWFTAWIDGEFLSEGPARFAPDYPEYEITRAVLPAGKHAVAALVHHH